METERFGGALRTLPAEVTTNYSAPLIAQSVSFVNGGWACFPVVLSHQTQSGSDRPVVRMTTLLVTAGPGQDNEVFKR